MFFTMERLKILTSLVLLLGVFWAVSPSSPVIYNKSESNPKIMGFVDFMFYYNAAKLTGGGEASEIYNQDLQQKNMSAIIGAPVKELIPYLYPPQSLLFFLPISGMSLQTSFLLWQGFNSIALLLGSVAYLIKYVNFTPRPHFIAGLINFNLFAMFIAELAPQFNALLWVPTQLILIVFIIYQMRKGKNLLDAPDQ